MGLTRSFPFLEKQSFVLRGAGDTSLTQSTPPNDPRFPRGPRLSGNQGTLDVWLTVGTGTANFLQITSPITGAGIVLGLHTSGYATGSITAEGGGSVATFAADALPGLVQNRTVHVQFAWSALVPIDGTFYAKAFVDGLPVAAADFTTPPSAAWVPFALGNLRTGVFAGSAFNGQVLLVQASTDVVI